ncbi:Transcriptional regulator, AbiEi antitoxin, Type IV TA system [Haloechinothrix alba]|uniref:Transcriptional regulator, AbiEi antitoxin, Type IV TA system n=1 Tax=Haloechinothrix alba TaxID=664784 RepID=A0A238XNS5_9PSEU|nr:type IV toxin-antitoxin system AbiEi family antitoxin domain-containing protein [Haloechinothrix alba]SNR59659.1 Transcriptional regulator, AbiEi antitoxin, Type IV TA system [Haloechinothrix alba]
MPDAVTPFTVAQARAAGCDRAAIRRALRSGRWVPLRRGVYVQAAQLAAVAGCPERRHAVDVAAVRLVLGFDAVAGGNSAARILGLDLLDSRVREPVLLTGAAAVKGTHRNGYVLRSAALPSHHRATRHGVPITSAARTVVDLARTRSFAEGVVVADSALRAGLVSIARLRALLGECSTWSGTTRARRVIDFADPLAESVLESLSRIAIHEQNLPAPRTQVTLGDDRGPRCRVDFLWDDVRVVGEADGLGKYEPGDGRSARDVVRTEKRREEWLADAGYEVLRWGWEDANDPPRLARRVRAAFARGAERQRGRQQPGAA